MYPAVNFRKQQLPLFASPFTPLTHSQRHRRPRYLPLLPAPHHLLPEPLPRRRLLRRRNAVAARLRHHVEHDIEPRPLPPPLQQHELPTHEQRDQHPQRHAGMRQIRARVPA